MEIISRVSSLIYFLAFRKKVGITKMPTTNQSTRKKTSLTMLITISIPANCLLAEAVERSTIITTATISWMMSTTIVKSTKGSSLRCISSNALMIIVVDDIASIPPRNMLCIVSHPIRKPKIIPTPIIATMPRKAVTKALLPTEVSLRKLNSSPNPKSRKMMPISDQTSISAISLTVGKRLR